MCIQDFHSIIMDYSLINKKIKNRLTNQGHNFKLSNRGARQVTIHTSKHNDIYYF